MKIDQGNIVLVPFPFTDLSSVKTRPALVISNESLKGDDVIVCGITSRKTGFDEIVINNKDLSKGKLPLTSYVRTGKIVTINKTIIKRSVARISEAKLKSTLKNVAAFLK